MNQSRLPRRAARVALSALLALVCVLIPGTSYGQTGNRLSRLQQEARDYLKTIEKQMLVVSKRIQEKQPEDADRLKQARARLIESIIYETMKEASNLLQAEKFIDASKKIEQVVTDIETVIRILEDQDLDRHEKHVEQCQGKQALPREPHDLVDPQPWPGRPDPQQSHNH